MSEPLVLIEQQCTYETLVNIVNRWNFSTVESPQLLSPELARYCVSFLTVERVLNDQITAVACSSSDGRHDLQTCLNEAESSWWISRAGSMPRGVGQEWIEFRLGPLPRRLSAVSIKIPPLPLGPLSVKEFQLQIKQTNDPSTSDWITLPTRHRVANRTGFQQFAIESIDAQYVRILCLQNQIADFIQPNAPVEHAQYNCVGFFSIRFD